MDESSEKGDAAGKTPPPFKPMQAWTMRAVFHWKHWEPALAFSQTIEALASCRHGSDAAVKSFFLHPLMNKTSWTSRLAAFLNITIAPMPRLMLRSPLEIVPRHWWRSDRGLVQQQISEWVSLKLFLSDLLNLSVMPDPNFIHLDIYIAIIAHFCSIVLAAWQQQVSRLKCRMGTWSGSEKEGGQSQGISSWPTPLSDLTKHKLSFQYWDKGFELTPHWPSFPVCSTATVPWRIAATDCHVYSTTWRH